MKVEDLDLIFIKFDKQVIISDKEGIIDKDSSIDFSLILEHNIRYDLFEIISNISKNIYNYNEEFEISKENENYNILNKKFHIDYFLDDLLIEFFKMLDKKIYTSYKQHINKIILIYDFIPYDIRLIIQQSALINGMNIIHMIDTNRALRFYIESSKYIIKIFKKYLAIIIKYDEHIEIAIYISPPLRKLYSVIKNTPEFLKDLKNIKHEKDGFIFLNISNEKNIFKKIREFITLSINSEMGYQNFVNIEQIYIFDANNDTSFYKKIFLGTSRSLSSRKTQQCKAIFKIIDENVEVVENKISRISIMNYEYNIKVKELPILLDLEIPFDDCFYTTINLVLYYENFNDNVLITIYFNQINYFYISLDIYFCNSIEFIFYKNFPEISFTSNEYKKIKYEEKFEDDEHFKRICMINVNREKLKSFLNLNQYKDIVSKELDFEDKNLTVVVGQDLKLLSYYQKQAFLKKSNNEDAFSLIELADNFNSKMLYKEVNFYKSIITKMYFIVKEKFRNYYIFMEFDDKEVNNIIKLMIAFGKYLIIKNIFIEEEPILKIDYDATKFKKFLYIIKKLEDFHQKCQNYIKNDQLMIAKLFLTASVALKKYFQLNEYSELNEDLIDLIDFKKEGTIYNSAFENNMSFILNLNKQSFLYPILLQFNSGFKNAKFNDLKVLTCMVSKLTLQQIKFDLIKSLDRYGIRIYFKTLYLGETVLSTDITIYNEYKLFSRKLSDEELLIKNDINYHKRTKVSFLQKHERFSHLKKIINKNEKNYTDSPRGYVDFYSNKIRLLIPKNEIKKAEIGEVLEYFLSGGNNQLIDNLYKCQDKKFNFIVIFDIDLLLLESNTILIEKLKTIQKSTKKEEVEIITIKKDEGIDDNRYKNLPGDEMDDKSSIKKSKLYYTDEYIEAKNKLLNEEKLSKFTFSRSTIISCIIVNNEFVPEED